MSNQVAVADLFGTEYIPVEKNVPSVKDLIKQISTAEQAEIDTQKALKSKTLTDRERITIITDKVYAILGKQAQNTIVIKTKEQFHNYVTAAIESGIISIDTETNNSLDPVTCKLMGLCLHYHGGKQAYIPINHVNINDDTDLEWELGDIHEKKERTRLEWQLTEKDCKDELQRILEADPKPTIIMHNGKFDYSVIKCTCHIEVIPDWDTLIGARVLDENELASLKKQYISKIDPSQEKYDIEHLFTNTPYAIVPPEVFALYAATDAMMTTALYLYQKPIFETPGNERLYWVFKNIEMPIVIVTAEMELTGVCVDVEFGTALKRKYEQLLAELDAKIEAEMQSTIYPLIEAWKLDPNSNAYEVTKVYQPKKTKLSYAQLQLRYPEYDSVMGLRFKYGKKKIEQIETPLNLASPTQLAILIYDILGCKSVSKKSPRGTGEEELEALLDKYPQYTLFSLILERRGYVKLISTYIDTIPALTKHWPDGRIRFHLNSMGTDTGRYSSGGTLKFWENDQSVEISGINIQNIPSRGQGQMLRLLFKADYKENEVEPDDNTYTVSEIQEVETTDGWKFPKDLVAGDKLITDDGLVTVKHLLKLTNLDYSVQYAIQVEDYIEG